jgi:hypothetical protein
LVIGGFHQDVQRQHMPQANQCKPVAVALAPAEDYITAMLHPKAPAMRVLLPALLLIAQPVAAAPVQERLAADHRAWIDEQARWNAQHMAAARRLEAVASALRHHDTSFDRHGAALRDHERQVIREGHSPAARTRHDRLRAAHAEAALRHRRLMDEVEELERSINTDLLPPVPATPPRR